MSHFPEGNYQGMSLKVNERSHGFWQRLIDANHAFPEGDYVGMSLKVNITVIVEHSIFSEK